MAEDLMFSGVRTRLGAAALAAGGMLTLPGCVPNSSEPPQALSNVQRQVCLDEGIDAARKVLSARNEQAGKGWLNKVYTPKDTPTDQDVFMAEKRRAEALCLQETREGKRKHAEDPGTTYPAFGTAGQAEPAAPVPAPAASAPEVVAAPAPAPVVVAVPVPVAPKALPRDAGVMANEGERIEPPVPAASAPAAGASAPEAAASAADSVNTIPGKVWERVVGKRAPAGPDAAASSAKGR